MTSLRFLPLALLAGLTIGCHDYLPVDDDQGRDDGATGGVIMPLAEGNRWFGRVTRSTDGGLTWTQEEELIEVNGARVEGGTTWYRLYANGEENGEATNKEDGLHGGEGRPACLQAKYPGNVGERFCPISVPSLIGSDDPAAPPVMQTITIATEIIATDSVITVPAGTFTCYVYHNVLIDAPNAALIQQRYDFYAPGVGPIRTDIYEHGQPGGSAPWRRWELLSYDLK